MLDKPIFSNVEGGQSNLEIIDLKNLGDQDFVSIAYEEFIFSSQYDREGHDLVITGVEGQTVIIEGYFVAPVAPDLVAADGAKLRGDIVKILAGPDNRGVYAQQGDIAGSTPIGQVETLEGTATVQRTDGTVEELQIGSKVFQNDVVQTVNGSTLSITFSDKTIFTLSADSRMVLSELVYAPDGADNSSVFNLVQGSFVFIAGQVSKTGDMKVETPVATMGIRGTTVTVNVVTDASGRATVTISLNRDIDGTVGAIELINNLDGSVTQITATSSSWVITAADGITTEIPRAADDLASDIVIINEAFNAVRSLEAREAAGEQPVNLDNVGTDEAPPQDGDDADDTPDDEDDTPGDQSSLGSGLNTSAPTDVTDVDGSGDTIISELGEGSVTEPLDDSGLQFEPDLGEQPEEEEDERPVLADETDDIVVADPLALNLPSLNSSVPEDGSSIISGFNFTGPGILTATFDVGSTLRIVGGSGVTIGAGSNQVSPGEYDPLVLIGTADQINDALNGATYTTSPNDDDFGFIDVTLTSSNGQSVSGRVVIDIIAINDAPTLDAITASFDEDSPAFDIDLAQFSNDVDGDALSFSTPNIDSEFFNAYL